jgi:uncharacterized phage protein (TIGR01671 family)
MNRQIKFRVWDKLIKSFIYGDKGYQGHYIITLDGKFHNLQNGSGGDEYVIQQWTGLTDRNGVDIYEGDYISFSTDNTVCLGDRDVNNWQGQEVHWDDEHATFIFGHKYEFTMLDRVMEETLEVQGNIFENSDIVEKWV